ncbi:YhhA family cyclophane-containing RiPP [Methylocapsa sp. S129]|uniref:YhhA family cyclophane-containing RiPP n=1 Tax=Methylocapsa sp. S129 TaxID=1641869 RepID=UPI00131C7D0E|nr:YhhA family cyclophane-containing RiPP [Methylocapsa sp. S129]
MDQPDHSELLASTPVTTDDVRRDEVEVDSVTLARLLAEVRNGDAFAPGAYNRQHNRHNR